MKSQAIGKQNYTPGLISLIALFYVGWFDTVLSPSEMKLIHRKIDHLKFLTKEEKKTLVSWTDPLNPPDDRLFAEWVHVMKTYASKVGMKEKLSFADLGIEMAKQGNRKKEDSVWHKEGTRRALMDIEAALELVNIESYQLLYRALDKPIESFPTEEDRVPAANITRLLRGDYHDDIHRLFILLNDPDFRSPTIRIKDSYRWQVLKWLHVLARQGLGSVSYPTEYGGEDNMKKYCAIFESLAHYDLSLTIKFGVQFGLFGGAILQLGTKKHHDKYLNSVGTLDLPGCFAMTETGHGSNVRDLKTSGVYDHNSKGFYVNTPDDSAAKEYIGNSLHGQLAVVFTQLYVKDVNHGVHAILVPIRDKLGMLLPGVRITDNGYKLGLNGVDNGKIWFERVWVPQENLLDRFGSVDENGNYSSPIQNPAKRFFTMLGTLVGGRICVGRAALSACKSALTIACKYGMVRRQFGPGGESKEIVLMDYPSHQRRLLPNLAKTYALHFALWSLTDEFVDNKEGNSRELETMAAALKVYATKHTTETIQECREACGGRGYLVENRLADLKADTEIFTTFEGDNTVLLQLVAKGLLSDFKQAFHDEGYRAVIRNLVQRFSANVIEKNPYSVRKTDASHLLDPDFHKNAFTYRKRRILNSLALRMRTLLRKKVPAFDAFLRVQNHMITLGHAYSEHVTLKYFSKQIDAMEGGVEKDLFIKLSALYALNSIDRDKGWFLENGYLEGSKTKAIRRMIDNLLKELRPSTNLLVSGLGIPQSILAAKITEQPSPE